MSTASSSAGFPDLEVLDLDASLYCRYAEVLGLEGASEGALALAQVVASDPWWETAPPAETVVRAGRAPLLGWAGNFDEPFRQRLSAHARSLRWALERLRWITNPEVEELTAELARCLRRELGDETLRRCYFRAIPRGGFIVLGHLSYHLGLTAGQLDPPEDPEAPCVLVDDISLSGFRLAEALSRWNAKRLVFATLLSPEPLRQAIAARESRVTHCISAQDLPDRTPELDHAEGEWRAGWEQALDGPRFWWGATDHVCFPWSEPDRLVRVGGAGSPEAGWRLAPPSHCLANAARSRCGNPTVQVMPEPSGPVCIAPRVLAAEWNGRVTVAHLDSGARLGLSDSAADFWRALSRRGSMDAALREIGNLYEAEPGALRGDFEAFVRNLSDQGFLTGEASG